MTYKIMFSWTMVALIGLPIFIYLKVVNDSVKSAPPPPPDHFNERFLTHRLLLSHNDLTSPRGRVTYRTTQYCTACFVFIVFLCIWSGFTLSCAVCRVHSGYWLRHTGWMAHARLIHRTHSKHIASSLHQTSYREACKLHRSVIALRPVFQANFTPAGRKGREIQSNAPRQAIWRSTGFKHVFKSLISPFHKLRP